MHLGTDPDSGREVVAKAGRFGPYVTELLPEDAGLSSVRGWALSNLRRFEEALADYSRALELRPDDPATLNNRGNTLSALRRFEAAGGVRVRSVPALAERRARGRSGERR